MLKKSYIIYSLLACLLVVLSTGCKDNKLKIKPALSTVEVSNITATSAISGGIITDDGGAPISHKGVVWGTTPEPTLESNLGKTGDGSGSDSFTTLLTDLTPNTTYHVRAYATNSEGTNYGKELSFKTLSGLTTLFTSTVRNISLTGATCGGSITDDGGAEIIARGIVWSTDQYPSVEVNMGRTNDGSGTGNWVSELTELIRNTCYYVRAYATNSRGTFYGEELTFITPNGIVIFGNSIVNDVILTSATVNSLIIDNGGLPINARGVVWDTSQKPSLENNSGRTNDGAGTGTFSSSLTGLNPNTTYYARTYATNSLGETSYNNTTVVKTRTGEVTDIDGNTYYTVTIGTQVWMAENLMTTKYNDGTDIPYKPGNEEWNIFTPAYCWVNNNPGLKETYGATYNWYVCDPASNGNRNVCPTGWHVPTQDEWAELSDLLGGTQMAGGHLKETGLEHWKSPNTGATNETGFTALPAGYRSGTGIWWLIGERGQWWASTETFNYSEIERTAFSAWIRNYETILTPYPSLLARCGHSIRCLKD